MEMVTRSWGSRRRALARRASFIMLNMSLLVWNLLSSLSSSEAAKAKSPTDTYELDVLNRIHVNAWVNTPGPDPCLNAWHGIICDGGAPRQHVLGINLSGTSGIIPATFFSNIGRLSYLNSLSMANCGLTGNLSALSGSLKNLSSILRFLDLSGNSLDGEIPKTFGNFQSLQSLLLARNQLQGKVPEDICGATSMIAMVLSSNSLEGPLPSCLGDLSNLAVLNFSDNNLNGPLPDSLGELKALTELNLGLNSLTGPLPASLTGLSNLTKLHLSGNLLEGPIPEDIFRMSKLKELNLDSNQFTGPIPVSICSLGRLQKLRLFDNQLNGSIPGEIGNLTKLTVLFLHVNRLVGPLPVGLGNLTLLQELQLQGNRLNGTLQASIWPRLTNLQSLYVHFNELEGEIPWETLLLGSLTNISLGFNKFTGSIPDPQKAPGAPHMLAKLIFVSMCNNSLSGPIPPDVSQLGNLEFLDFSNNHLNGSISFQLVSLINSDRVQANIIFNDFDLGSWSALQGSRACSQLLNSSVNQQCPNSGFSKGLGINVGGPQVQSEVTGVQFVADESFTSLLGSYESSSDSINNSWTTSWVMSEQGAVQESGTSIITSSSPPPAEPPEWPWIRDWTLFQTARVGGDTLSYRIGYLTAGEYLVGLFFAELDELVKRPGQRVFNVYIQGELKVASLDIFNRTGGTMRPLVFVFPVSVSHGVIDVRLVGRGSWPATQDQMMVSRGPILSALNVGKDEKSKSKVALVIAAVVGGSVFALVVLVVACVSYALCGRRRRSRFMPSGWTNVGLVTFKYTELEAATGKFSERNLLGQGAFGKVFKGVLPHGVTVAIKQLSKCPNTYSVETMQNELVVISTVRHRNLVPLIGCCLEKECPIIVCQYMPNGNLHEALFKESSPVFLSWSARCKIAMDIARGLHYLHEESVHKILHRDVKPSNVLLDLKLSGHIADFGMARLLAEQEQEIEVITGAMGTRGYMAPEYALNGQLSDKVDVFSFGVVLLELVVGRRGMQTAVASSRQVPLCQWAWQMLMAGEVEEMVDKRLGKDYILSEVMTMLKVAIWCTEFGHTFRPSMSQVIRMLSNQVAVPALPLNRRGYEDESQDLTGRPFDTPPWENYMSSRAGGQSPNPLLELFGSRSCEYSGEDLYSLEGR